MDIKISTQVVYEKDDPHMACHLRRGFITCLSFEFPEKPRIQKLEW